MRTKNGHAYSAAPNEAVKNSNGEKRGELSNGIYVKLKEMICSGALRPHETLNLHGLTKIFNTSVTPVSSALSMLSKEGLVVKRPNKSAVVASMSVDEVKNIWLKGALLEGMASYLAASRISSNEIESMEKFAKEMEDLGIPNDIDRFKFKEVNQKFHGIFLRACGNRELLHLIKESSLKLYRYYVLAASLQGAVSDFAVQHRLIIKNLKERDPKGARNAVEEHIISEGEKVIRCLEAGLE